jgi:hypothetical protein
MTSEAFEAVLARLYVDAEWRARFLDDPERVLRDTGLSTAEVDALLHIDRTGLALAANGFRIKNESRQPPRSRGLLARLRERLLRRR